MNQYNIHFVNLYFENNVLEKCEFNNCALVNSNFILLNADCNNLSFIAVESINTEFENWDNEINIDSSCSGFP